MRRERGSEKAGRVKRRKNRHGNVFYTEEIDEDATV